MKSIWSNDIIENDTYNEDYENNNIENSNNSDIKSNSNNLDNNFKKNDFITNVLISKLIKLICVSDYKKNKKNEGIHYNTLLLNRVKLSIINIPITNLIALGIFSQETKSSIIRIFLLNMIISFLNYTGDKKEFLTSDDINSLNKMNSKNFNSFLKSKIYDTFLSIPIQLHFGRITKKIFKRRALYIKDIYYKNYYLVDLDSDKIILSLESLHDKNNSKEPELKTSDQKSIWNDLIFHCHNLKNDYIKKNNMTFNGIDYQNFFVKIEYKVTFPRRNFIIKFLPLFNGMCIIHEYIQLKLSTFEGEEKKAYSEKKIIYGYDAYDNIFRNSDNRYFENEHYILKQVHFFIIESLFCSNSSISYFFNLARKPKIYFSEEILEIIDREIKDYFKYNKNLNNIFSYYEKSSYHCTNEIINRIINVLYEEYIQINNSEKILHKSSNQIPNSKNKNSLMLKEIEALNKSKSLKITKNETLVFLFNSIQFNKNINPNDITIDLNDERISQLRITQNDNDEFPSPRKSDLIDKKERPISIRLSELLAEKPSLKNMNEKNNSKIEKENFPIPLDSEINDNRNETEEPLKDEEFNNEGNKSNENSKEFSYYKYNQNNSNQNFEDIDNYDNNNNNNKTDNKTNNNTNININSYNNQNINYDDNNNNLDIIDKDNNNENINNKEDDNYNNHISCDNNNITNNNKISINNNSNNNKQYNDSSNDNEENKNNNYNSNYSSKKQLFKSFDDEDYNNQKNSM